MDRRNFLKQTGMAIGAAAAGPGALAQARGRVSVVMDPKDPVASAPPVRWAAQELQRALAERGMAGGQFDSADLTADTDFCILAAGPTFAGAAGPRPLITVPDTPEALTIVPTWLSDRSGLTVLGRDPRGLVYALLEIADRVRHSEPISALAMHQAYYRAARQRRPQHLPPVRQRRGGQALVQRPRNVAALSHHAGRAALQPLQPGAGHRATISCAKSPTPISCSPTRSCSPVPGYNVRATNLPDAERDRNLEMLRFISEQTVARGMEFQLGLWMHGYQWIDSPQ